MLSYYQQRLQVRFLLHNVLIHFLQMWIHHNLIYFLFHLLGTAVSGPFNKEQMKRGDVTAP